MLSAEHTRLLIRLRWTAFGLIAGAYVLAFFHRTAPAAIAAELARDFQVGPASLGILASSYFWIYMVMQIPTGVLADTLGPRRIVALGGVIAGIGSILFALADGLGGALAGRTLVGLGVSFPFIALLKINAAWFPENRFATLNGITMFIGNMGAASAALPLAWIVAHVSWRTVFVALGLLSMLIALLTWLRVRDRPEDAGLPTLRELDGKPAHPPMPVGDWKLGLKHVASNRASWPGLFVNAGIAGTLFSFAGLWGVPYLMTVHALPRAVAAQHTTLVLVMFAFTCLGVGRLSDLLQRRKPVMLGFGVLYLVGWLPFAIGGTLPLWASYAACAVIGISASSFSLTWACAKEVNPPALSGMATSLVNTGCFLGAALLQPLVGWVIELQSPSIAHATPAAMTDGMRVLLAAAIGGVTAMFFVRETGGRNLTERTG
ncbi:MFS transporter [Methyloversatilis thermotolerans]|uniref:MFS transporter n=1 Tax=Methyloversatilis thermotolerans TaxID=1346290 RepID=UPI0003A182B1|nr:MFS transporter [Methyloversatilis thermotolerans]